MKLPEPLTSPHGKSAMTRIIRRSTATAKATITDTFTSLANWVTLSGNATITSGMLTGKVAVRYRDEMLSDNYKVTATVGQVNDGRCWLVTSANADFSRFYAAEVNSGGLGDIVSIIKGTSAAVTASTGILGMLAGYLGFLLGLFEDLIAALFNYAEITTNFVVGDTLTVWWDEPNTVVRVYRNAAEITTLPVPRPELMHTEGYRYFGVVTGIDDALAPGLRFTQVVAQDV